VLQDGETVGSRTIASNQRTPLQLASPITNPYNAFRDSALCLGAGRISPSEPHSSTDTVAPLQTRFITAQMTQLIGYWL
jgi:hypothetical protein